MKSSLARRLALTASVASLVFAGCTQPDVTFRDETAAPVEDGPAAVAEPPTNTEPPTTDPVDPLSTDVTDHLDLPDVPYRYESELPEHFRTNAVAALDNTPAENPITDDGATLGRVLFYDPALSQNRTVACASCHAPSVAFSDDVALSEGFDGGLTGRHSMALVNVRYYPNGRMFWDERADTLEEQVLMPIQDTVEMGLTLDQLVERVEGEPYYPELFSRAFGSEQVTTERISRALAQFVRSLSSHQSRFDEGLAQAGDIRATFANFSQEEELGKQLFLGRARCAACHLDNPPPGGPGGGPPELQNQAIFQLRGPANNGLDAGRVDGDDGVGAETGNANDDDRFKSSSLRNIALSAPYMHDGRFDTLEEVVTFYDEGVQAHPNLDPRLMQNGQPQRLGLTDAEKQALVAFLGTLTDTALVTDPRFQNPFVAAE